MNSRSASSAPAALARLSPDPTAPRGFVVRCPEGGHAAGGEDHRLGRDDERRAVARPDGEADGPAVVDGDRGCRQRLQHLHTRVRGCERRERARDSPPGGGAAGVDDPAPRVAALEAEREVPPAVGVELNAELLKVAHAVGRLLAQHPHRALSCGLAAGGERVGGVLRGRVVRSERRGDPALGPEARGLRERRAADERDACPLVRGHERRVQAGGAGANNCDVGAERLVHGAQVPYRRGMPPFFRHPASLEHDTGHGHPERADRIRAIEAELESREWLGWEPREAPAATEEQLLRVHPAEYVARVRDMSARGEAFDLDTPTSPGSYEAALRAAGGACALAEALLGGGERTGFSALRPPGHHAEWARALGFCLFANVAVASRHALDSLGAERVLVLDWDVHHGNGTNAIFHDSREVLFVSIHQFPFWPGTGPLDDVGEGRGRATRSTCPCRVVPVRRPSSH